MGKNFYISDLHFGHANVIKFDNRPFENLEEMHNTIITNWNNTVTNEDTVYILGDFCWGVDSAWPQYLEQLKGKKVLVQGNHDIKNPSKQIKKYFLDIKPYKEITDEGRRVIMCHYPMPMYRGAYNKDIYNLIQDKIEKGTLQSELRSSWIASITGQPSEFYDVVNAYINLMYFDKVLDKALGTYIKIDDSLLEPISVETNSNGKIETKYKYSFNSGNAETVKGWETAENRDAIKEMGKFSKLIINSIPFYNYQTKEKLNINLNAVRFSNAITRLLDISNELDAIDYADFLNLVNYRHFKPEENFPKLLDLLFSENHKSLV